MATMADDAVFLDTNILIYAELTNSPFHFAARQKLSELHAQDNSFWISRQIIREDLVATTRAHSGVIGNVASEAVAGIQKVLQIVSVANEGAEVSHRLLELVERFGITGKQIHDTNIVATMLAYKIPRLLTHNGSDFFRYGSLITVIPLQ